MDGRRAAPPIDQLGDFGFRRPKKVDLIRATFGESRARAWTKEKEEEGEGEGEGEDGTI